MPLRPRAVSKIRDCGRAAVSAKRAVARCFAQPRFTWSVPGWRCRCERRVPGIAIPDAAIRALVWAAVAGFPVALVFGWLRDRRRRQSAHLNGRLRRPFTRHLRRRRDYLILAAFAAMETCSSSGPCRRFARTPLAELAAGSGRNRARWRRATAEFDRGAPLCQHQQRSRQRYFCDGIAEEILNALSELRGWPSLGGRAPLRSRAATRASTGSAPCWA